MLDFILQFVMATCAVVSLVVATGYVVITITKSNAFTQNPVAFCKTAGIGVFGVGLALYVLFSGGALPFILGFFYAVMPGVILAYSTYCSKENRPGVSRHATGRSVVEARELITYRKGQLN